MDFTMKQWLIGLIVIAILVILADGFRRMRRARYDSLHMSLKVKKDAPIPPEENDDILGSEFPNGGARKSQKQIDKERIGKVKSQYDFGRDISMPLPKKTPSTQPEQDEFIDEQWVDTEDGDEEYYAQQWDDEEPVDNRMAFSAVDDEPMDELMEEQEGSVENVKKVLRPQAAPQQKIVQQTTTKTSEEPVAELEEDSLVGEALVVEPSVDDSSVELQPYAELEQVPLNLDEAVPMLMESVDEDSEVKNKQSTVQKNIRPVGKRVKPSVEPTADEEVLDTHSANKPRFQSKYFSSKPTEPEAKKSTITEVFVINVKAPEGELLSGSDLLPAALKNGLRYGAMNIFHCHSDDEGEGPVLFSMANMLKPGVFDLKTMDDFSTAGVTFFMTMPVYNNKNIEAFETMLATAKNIAASLGGELKDDQRSVMTAQTIEHYKERIRDFSRRLHLEKNK